MKHIAALITVATLVVCSTLALASSLNIRIIVDGEEVLCDPPAFIKDGRTFVPLRFVAEALGAKVEWDQASRTVVVSTNGQPATPPDPTVWISLKALCERLGYTPEFIGAGKIPLSIYKDPLLIEVVDTGQGPVRVRAFNSRTYLYVADLEAAGLLQ